jgi:hypothetical protein
LPKKAKIYTNTKIPAVRYFEILETGDLSLLKKNKGKVSKKKLRKAWMYINDEVYLKRGSRKQNVLIRHQKKMLELIRKKEIAKTVLKAIYLYTFRDNDLKEIIKELESIGVKINIENNILEEINNALVVQLGSWETEIKLIEDDIKNLTAGEKVSFLETIVLFEDYGYKVEEDVTMEKYLVYEKFVKEKAKNNK